MTRIKSKTPVVLGESFYFLSVLSVAFIILEVIWPNIILAYFNLNWLLTLWLTFGLATLIRK